MHDINEWINIDQKSETPVYLQITNTIIHNIMNGRLRKGLKLPGSRLIAESLHINRMTIVAVFDELQAQGWITVVPRKGTFISNELPALNPSRIIPTSEVFCVPAKPIFALNHKRVIPYPSPGFPDLTKLNLNDGFPDAREAPTAILMRNLRSLSQQKSYRRYLMYGGPEGTETFRQVMAETLRDTRGIPVNKENIQITRGSQMAIFIAASLLVKPGDDIIVGEPSYFGANKTFEQIGARLNRAPVDENGIDVDAVEAICRRRQVKMIYVIPHHHHPTTVTLTPDRRIRLLALSVKYKFAILEDDYDYDFHYASKPMMPMASLDRHGSVIYIGTLTKTLAPAFRIGFMAASEDFIRLAANFRRFVDHQGDSLLENAVASLYRDGTIARHIKKTVKLYKERRDQFCALMTSELGDHVKFRIPDGGMSVWTNFTTFNLVKLSGLARKQGLIMSDGTDFNSHNVNYNSARLGFASLRAEEQITAIGIIKKCLK